MSNKPLNGIVSIIDTDNGVEVASKFIRPDGTFDFELIAGSHYAMLIQSPDFFSVEKQFALRGDTVMTLLTNSINYKLPLIFKNLEFEQSKSNVLVSMHPTLDRIAVFLVDHPTFRLSIAGHTDSSGDPEVNEKLAGPRRGYPPLHRTKGQAATQPHREFRLRLLQTAERRADRYRRPGEPPGRIPPDKTR